MLSVNSGCKNGFNFLEVKPYQICALLLLAHKMILIKISPVQAEVSHCWLVYSQLAGSQGCPRLLSFQKKSMAQDRGRVLKYR